MSTGKISNACSKDKKEDYVFVTIKKKHYYVHRLVCQTFLENPENKEIVNHINGIKHDNRLENLEFVTVSENSIHAVNIGLIKCKKIIQYSIEGVKIKSFERISQASKETNINRSDISSCCTGKRRSAGGFLWKYYDDLEEIKIYIKKIPSTLKPVIQYSIEGDKIKEFDSMKIASKETNISSNNIHSCCTGKRKIAGGFKWSFCDEYQNKI